MGKTQESVFTKRALFRAKTLDITLEISRSLILTTDAQFCANSKDIIFQIQRKLIFTKVAQFSVEATAVVFQQYTKINILKFCPILGRSQGYSLWTLEKFEYSHNLVNFGQNPSL